MEKMEISQSLFTDWIYARISEFGDHYLHNDDFWNAVVDYFEEIGWDSIPLKDREPSIIVDNIAINGDIQSSEEIMENYNLDSEEEVDELAEKKGWLKLADLYVINWGF